MKKILKLIIPLLICAITFAYILTNTIGFGQELPVHSNASKDAITFNIYYLDKQTNLLVYETPKISVYDNNSISAVVNALILGPLGREGEKFLPKNLKLIDGFIDSRIAYLNFDRTLEKLILKRSKDVNLIIYAIVNSVSSIEGVDRVQILIEGERLVINNRFTYYNPLVYNLGVVKGKSKEQITQD